MSVIYVLKTFCLAIVILAKHVASENITLTIPLSKTTTYWDKELYSTFITLNRASTLQVNFTDVNINISFFIFQVHSHLYNVTLYQNEYVRKSYVNGTNIGLYSEVQKKLDTFYIMNTNENVDLVLFVAVHGYSETDPVPGGCNMEFPVETSPFMSANIIKSSYIFIDAAPPKYDVNCLDVNQIDVRFYMMYLPQQNFDSDVYFDAIRNFTSLGNIIRNGRFIIPTREMWRMRRSVSAYPGTGAVYVAVARAPGSNGYSVYVPTHSYGCSPLVEDDCELLEDSLSRLLSASLFFLGIFVCYYGHRFFKTNIFLIGFFSGLIVTYILISLIYTMDRPGLLAASALSGIFLGALRVVTWWIYGLPLFAILLPAADFGFLIAAVLYYSLPAYFVYYLQNVFHFWSLYILFILLISIILLSTSFIANLLCCAVIGAYAASYSIDYYLGSNMKYILNNVIRRATVNNFNYAAIVSSFQWRDGILTFLWLTFATTGFLYQYYQNRGRPPFPPPPRSVRAVPEDCVAGPSGYRNPNIRTGGNSDFNERTPLLA